MDEFILNNKNISWINDELVFIEIIISILFLAATC